MFDTFKRLLPLWVALLIALPVVATAQPTLESGTVMEAAARLKAGEYMWAPDVAPEGPVLLVVSLATQRAVLYRNGLPIAISTVSSGRPGHDTPTGIFTVLQRRVEHYSNLYNNAPMPYMQRLTWDGVALHGGNLPGYPASHGCIRLPQQFARQLFGVTHLGMTVVVTDRPAVPRVALSPDLLQASQSVASLLDAPETWTPERSPTGPVSIVVSAADRRVVVLRNGVPIGTAPVTIDGEIGRTSAFVLSRVDAQGPTWLRVPLPGQSADETPEQLRGRIHVPETFRRSVESVLAPGITVVVTGDSLRAGSTGDPVMVAEEEPAEG